MNGKEKLEQESKDLMQEELQTPLEEQDGKAPAQVNKGGSVDSKFLILTFILGVITGLLILLLIKP